ncbi:splicing factor 3B subunit1-like HEAT repeat-containing protein, partial [Cryptosporidium canis]
RGLLEPEIPLYEIPEASAPQQEDFGEVHDAGQQGYMRQVFHSELGELSLKMEDFHFFAKIFSNVSDDDLSPEEVNERLVLTLLLKIKNGASILRRKAMKQIVETARDKGPGIVLNSLLPLLMQSTLEEQERHILVKTLDRVLQRLGSRVKPFVHKILVVIEPMLIDQDYYARQEGREIISNLAKAVGLATMIATMRPDIDHPDEYVRNTTAKAFAILASAMGIPSLVIFLQAVCQSKKSWQARHTGIRIVQQIAILHGSSVLPHLKSLVQIISHGLGDDNQKVRVVTALSLASLAEASSPYGIEAFEPVLGQIWRGISEYRSRNLASFLKAMGQIISLMEVDQACHYIREISPTLVREFASHDDEMKRVVLKVLEQCIKVEEIGSDFVKRELLGPFISQFWTPRNSLDRRTSRLVVNATVLLSKQVGLEPILEGLLIFLRDSSETFRIQALEAVRSVMEVVEVIHLEHRLEKLLVDGILYIFQESSSEESTSVVEHVGRILTLLGTRSKQYLPQISSIIRWRLNTPSPGARQTAADLVAQIIGVMKQCEEEQMIAHIGLFLYEYLGEEYPEVLGSIIGALHAIVAQVGVEKLTPPIKELVPRLTPILKNRHEKVQENIIQLLGCCAKKGGDLVSPKEWDRICFDLLDSLKSNKRSIRRASVQTFGYIAKTIGPQDVLVTLLNNLRVQERQLRVCTTIAIAIISEVCMPYTVLPALMNEYRIPDLNVQNGVLKTLSFMFEYIGAMSKDYIYALTPLLEVALTDRDQVHRQTAAWACKHLALGVAGMGCNDALIHLLNFLWPNVFENSPHLVQAVYEALDAFRVALGPGVILSYLLQGLFHPAKKVRSVYWRIYNTLYIGSQDSLVPFFPEIPSAGDRSFDMSELYYCI